MCLGKSWGAVLSPLWVRHLPSDGRLVGQSMHSRFKPAQPPCRAAGALLPGAFQVEDEQLAQAIDAFFAIRDQKQPLSELVIPSLLALSRSRVTRPWPTAVSG
jgi:hypothetical protein